MAISANIFRQDAFSGLTLTEMVNRFPFNPQFLGQLKLFEDMPILTTAVQINQKQGILSLVGSTPRGAPAQQRYTEKRQGRYFECTRLAVEDTITAEELQNVISEKNEAQTLKDLQEEVAIRITGPTGLTSMIEYTWEYHRLGAVQGILVDAPAPYGTGAVINNWFQEFGIAQAAPVVFGLAANTPNTVIPLINGIKRTTMRKGQGAFLEGVTEVHALCGDTFFDLLTQHVDVVRTYANWQAANDGAPQLREGRVFGAFRFGDVYWHNYRGSDDNSTVAIPLNAAKFFPVKAPGVFKRALAPGEGFGALNNKGKPMYVTRDIHQAEEPLWVNFKNKSFPLHICTRPEMLLSATA